MNYGMMIDIAVKKGENRTELEARHPVSSDPGEHRAYWLWLREKSGVTDPPPRVPVIKVDYGTSGGAKPCGSC